MMSDWRLLREYVERNSEAAFAELVDRHMKLVYGTCRRDLGDTQLAEDSTQAVFLLLARKANSLSRNVSVPGWLFNAARLIARNAARVENRRRHYEGEAVRSMEHSSQPEASRQEIDPWLNDALSALKPADREVVLMRYFDDLTFCEIADQTGTAENTAVQRAKRALEKMRRYMAKKEVTITSVALAALLADHAAEAASDTCRAATLQAIHHLTAGQATAFAASSHLALLQKGVHFTMQATKYKIAAGICAAVLAAAIGTGAMISHAHTSKAKSAPSVEWAAPQASDLAKHAAEQQIQGQLGHLIGGFNSRKASDILAVITPDCVFASQDQTTAPKPLSSALDNSGQAFFASMAPDASMKAIVSSCRVTGNTAVVRIDLTSHGIDSRRQGNGPVVYYDTAAPCDLTFIYTGGHWLISHGEKLKSKQIPSTSTSGQ